MPMKRILIVGASSFIGANIATALRGRHPIVGTYSRNIPRIDGIQTFRFTLTPGAQISELLEMTHPDVVIYCAAEVSDHLCGENPEQALYVNAEAPYHFARALQDIGKRLIFLSTSKVFSGNQGNYAENDEALPQNLYAKMKLHGEQQLRNFENLFILRLGTIFGVGSATHKSAILNRFLWELWQDKPLSLIADEFRSFLAVSEVARAVEAVIEAPSALAGLYHLSHQERHTYFTFGKELSLVFGLVNAKLNPIPGSAFGGEMAASGGARGNDLTLDGSLFEKTFGVNFRGVIPSLVEIREVFRKGMM